MYKCTRTYIEMWRRRQIVRLVSFCISVKMKIKYKSSQYASTSFPHFESVRCFMFCLLFFFYYSLYFSFHFALFAVADEIQRLSNVQPYSAFHAFDGVLSRSKSLQACFCTFFFHSWKYGMLYNTTSLLARWLADCLCQFRPIFATFNVFLFVTANRLPHRSTNQACIKKIQQQKHVNF